MSSNIAPGRNEPCPCGSGLKYKACCDGKTSVASVSRSPYTLVAIAVAVVAAGFFLVKGREAKEPKGAEVTTGTNPALAPPPAAAPAPMPGSSLPSAALLQPQPAPVGGLTPGVLTPQPPGPVPDGKVWSPEHGHWHDAAPPGATTITPGSTTITPTPVQMTPGPQPPGPVPAGKVWSAEHGHWHDAPPGGAPPPP